MTAHVGPPGEIERGVRIGRAHTLASRVPTYPAPTVPRGQLVSSVRIQSENGLLRTAADFGDVDGGHGGVMGGRTGSEARRRTLNRREEVVAAAKAGSDFRAGISSPRPRARRLCLERVSLIIISSSFLLLLLACLVLHHHFRNGSSPICARARRTLLPFRFRGAIPCRAGAVALGVASPAEHPRDRPICARRAIG